MQQVSEPIEIGWTVYDRDGEKVGSIAEVGPNYVLVHKGVIFGKDIYVPTSHLAAVNPEQEAVQLPVRRDDLDVHGWDEPPVWIPPPAASHDDFADDGLPTDLSVFRAASATDAAQF